MEVIVVHVREYLNLTTPKGFAPLHFAASYGHTQVCSLLAAEVLMSFVSPCPISFSLPEYGLYAHHVLIHGVMRSTVYGNMTDMKDLLFR